MNMDIRIDIELKKNFKYEFAGTEELTFEESRRSIPSHLIISYIYLNTCTILETIFKKQLAKSLTSYHLKSIFQNLSIKTVVSEALEDGGCYI